MINVVNTKTIPPNVVAVSSLCEDGNHILIWDFDYKHNPTTLRKIENILSDVLIRYDLSNVFILESRNGYNAISLNKLSFEKVFNIKLNTKLDDEKHNLFGYDQGHWRIRYGTDKKVVSTLRNISSKYSNSNAHRIFMNKMLNCSIKQDYTFDDHKNVLMVGYWSWKEECENGK